jgi:hypothetical protein
MKKILMITLLALQLYCFDEYKFFQDDKNIIEQKLLEDGSTLCMFLDGSQKIIFPDGKIICIFSNGNQVIFNIDGTVEVILVKEISRRIRIENLSNDLMCSNYELTTQIDPFLNVMTGMNNGRKIFFNVDGKIEKVENI